MKVTVAAVQPKTATGEGSFRLNLERAALYLDEAVSRGAEIVCYPEIYPGPFAEPFESSPHPVLSQLARDKHVYIIYGLAERIREERPDAHHIVQCLVGPDGKLVGKYNRCCPPRPWQFAGGPVQGLHYMEGDNLPVFDTAFGKIGILLCSEVFMPELSRSMAIQGALITFLPAGIKKGPNEELYDAWKVLLQARALENQMYTVSCQNIMGGERGLAMICAPEGRYEFSDREGVTVTECDLDRVKTLRESADSYGNDFRTKPGTLRDWRRPDLYRDILCSPPK